MRGAQQQRGRTDAPESGREAEPRALLDDPVRRIRDLETACDRLEKERAWLERECRELREHLESARERARRDEALILSQNDERQALEETLRSIFASRTWRLGAPLRNFMVQVRRFAGFAGPLHNGIAHARDVRRVASKAVLFISGCPGDAKRYRCDHAAEQLESLGVSTEVTLRGSVVFDEVVDRFTLFILHRVAHDSDVECFIRRARAAGRLVLFDSDDWVFDLEAARYVAALEDMTSTERALYRQGLIRYRETISLCDAILVSTGYLAELALGLGKPVYVLANVVSREMTERANAARTGLGGRRLGRESSDVTIGYFSGTPTHNRDFAEAADAIEWAMDAYANVRLLTVGHIDVSARFSRFGNRFEHLPLMPWQQLSEVMARVDVNLAPLERQNPFTASKSCVKYLEAAMVGVPTIATPLPDYCRVIEHGRNGLLAEKPEEWQQGLRQLIESPELRGRLGARAHEDLVRRHTTPAHARRVLEALKCTGASARADEPLTINWVLRAPIAGTGGGYWTIFRLANHLGAAGHLVRVYVEPIAHLEGRSRSEIERFLEDNFGPLHVEPIVGHDRIQPADVSIATNWPTAYTVARHRDSLFRFYFVQDFEPEFYSERDPLYREAERTYDLPLQHVCIGRSLAGRISRLTGRTAECIDFAVDTSVFRTTRPPAERPGPIRVLFFARPGLKRRGFGLGLAALEELVRRRPEVSIAFFGAANDELGAVRFPFTNLGILSHEELAHAMNETHILLSFSLSANVSWVPLQAMACGCAVVEANLPGVREMIDDGETCLLAEPSPGSVTDALVRLVDDAALRCRIAEKASSALAARSWESSARQFERVLLDRCFTRIEPRSREAMTSVELADIPLAAPLLVQPGRAPS